MAVFVLEMNKRGRATKVWLERSLLLFTNAEGGMTEAADFRDAESAESWSDRAESWRPPLILEDAASIDIRHDSVELHGEVWPTLDRLTTGC
jgi:hypothetical protein